MTLDLPPAAVSARLREVGRRSDLRAERRLDTKIDMSPAAISRRLRTVGQLTSLCLRPGRRPVRPASGGAVEYNVRMRALVVAILMALCAPAFAGLVAADPHACRDHVCQCRPARPAAPAPRSTMSCHETGASAAPTSEDCVIRGTCQHDLPQIAAFSTFVLPHVATVSDLAFATVRPAPASTPLPAGFDRIDPRPPRLRS